MWRVSACGQRQSKTAPCIQSVCGVWRFSSLKVGYPPNHSLGSGQQNLTLPAQQSVLDLCEDLSLVGSSTSPYRSEEAVATYFDFAVHEAAKQCTSTNEMRLTSDNLDTLLLFVAALSNASLSLPHRRTLHYRTTTSFLDTNIDQQRQDVTSSPYLRGDALDFVSAICAFCIREITASLSRREPLPAQLLYEILNHAVQLEVCDPTSLATACRALTSRQLCARMTNSDLVETLHLVSLCHKRRRVPLPTLDSVLSRLQVAKELDSRQLLMVLSSLARVRRGGTHQHCDTSLILSRRLSVRMRQSLDSAASNDVSLAHARSDVSKMVARVDAFSNTDLVFALRIASLLEVTTSFVSAVLELCTLRVDALSPGDLGNVCKYMKQIHTSRQLGHLTRTSCGKETRRLVPRLLARATVLLGQFSLRDARHVLECLDSFQQRHSVVFSQLTPFVSGSA